jgi:hypothetical protein
MKKPSSDVFSSPLWAAASLAPVAPPKVKPKQQSYPSYVRSTAPSEGVIRRDDRQLANKNLLDYRVANDTRTVIRDLAASSPDLAGARNAYLRVALTQSYKALARNMDGSVNPEATRLTYELLQRFDLVPNYVEDGFTTSTSIRSAAESLAKEIMETGSCASELVLDKQRLPARIACVSTLQIKFYEDKDKNLRPIQVIGGEEIDLDYPTFFYTSLDQDLLSPYSTSPLESAIQPVLADAEYTNDLRRVLKRAIHPRLQALIDTELVRQTMPPEYMNDPVKMKEYFDTITSQIESVVNGLSPEDALVSLNLIEYSYVAGGTGEVPDVIETVQKVLNAKLATGAKTLPSILGHGAGTQNMASSETLMFMKNADGTIRVKLNEHLSKMLTLAVRLFGHDVAVYFAYDPIELRPVNELEAFYAMRQARVLELLSHGFLEDEAAAIELTGQLPGPKFKPLSGTGFFMPDPATAEGNPYSGTSGGGSGGGAANQARKPNTPTKPKSLAQELVAASAHSNVVRLP